VNAYISIFNIFSLFYFFYANVIRDTNHDENREKMGNMKISGAV